MNSRLIGVGAALVAVLAVAGAAPASATDMPNAASASAFVVRSGDDLRLGGKSFRMNGTNHFLMYKSSAMVDDVLHDARTAGFQRGANVGIP